MIDNEARHFFQNFAKTACIDHFQRLPQSGSARVNWHARANGKDFIVTFNQNLRENKSFFYFSNLFSELHLNTPKILDISSNQSFYIQEHMGENTLSQIIEKEGFSDNVKALVKQTLHQLYHLQTATKGKIDYTQTFEYECYDSLPIIHDLYYFKNFMVDALELPYHKSSLLKEFYTIAERVEQLQPKTLMIRDFQARNIMINSHNKVGFIDYQSAMEGAAMYDVVSFLFQAKANFPQEFRNEMLNYYISLYQCTETRQALQNSIPYIQLMRFLQVLGAYGFRGLVQKKPHFINSIEQGIDNIYHFIKNWENANDFPELKQVIHKLKQHQDKIITI